MHSSRSANSIRCNLITETNRLVQLRKFGTRTYGVFYGFSKLLFKTIIMGSSIIFSAFLCGEQMGFTVGDLHKVKPSSECGKLTLT